MIWPIFFPTKSHPFNLWNYLKAVFLQIYSILLLCVCSLTHLYLLSLLPLLWLSSEFPWFCVASVLSSSFLCRFLYPFCRFCGSCILFCASSVSRAIVTHLGTDASAGLEVNLWVREVWTHLSVKCQGLTVKNSIPLGSQSPSAPRISKKVR